MDPVSQQTPNQRNRSLRDTRPSRQLPQPRPESQFESETDSDAGGAPRVPMWARLAGFAIEEAARRVAEKLNKEIDKGNDTIAFIIALSLAAFKDFLDIVLTFLGIGLIPGVNFLVGAFLTTFLYIFMVRKGWFLKWRFKFWYWVLGLFFDGLPAVSTLPMNTILVLYAWYLVKKRKRKAEQHLKELHEKTLEELETLDQDMSLLER